MTQNTHPLPLRVSETAAVQLGLARTPLEVRDLPISEAKWREEQRALKRQGIESAKAATKAKRQAALDSDVKLRAALDEHQKVVNACSVKTRDQAEKQREIERDKCDAAAAVIADLEQKLEAAKARFQHAHEQAVAAETWHEHVVTQANARLDTARETVQAAWLDHEAEWATHGKAFVRKHRDRSVRRDARSVLSIRAPR
jgi:hypothetical protein